MKKKIVFLILTAFTTLVGIEDQKKSEYAQKIIDRLQEVVEEYGKDNLPCVSKMNALLRSDPKIVELQKAALPLFTPPWLFFKKPRVNQREFFHYAALQAHFQKKYYVAAVLDGYDPMMNETIRFTGIGIVFLVVCFVVYNNIYEG